MKKNFPIYVISLARAHDRRRNICKRLDDAGVEYELVDAVDGKTIDPTLYEHRLRQDLSYKRHQERLNQAEIGCFLSHYSLWERMISEQTPHALILEDDVCWHDEFFEIVEMLPKVEWLWDFVLLSQYGTRKLEKILCDFPHGYQLARFKRPSWGSIAYAITLSGARKLHKQCFEINGTLDTMMRRYWESNLMWYEVIPPPAYQSGEQTLLHHDRGSLTKAEKRQRSLMRKYRNFRRKLYHLTHPPKRL